VKYHKLYIGHRPRQAYGGRVLNPGKALVGLDSTAQLRCGSI